MGETGEAVEEKALCILMPFFPEGGLHILSSAVLGLCLFLSPSHSPPMLWHPNLIWSHQSGLDPASSLFLTKHSWPISMDCWRCREDLWWDGQRTDLGGKNAGVLKKNDLLIIWKECYYNLFMHNERNMSGVFEFFIFILHLYLLLFELVCALVKVWQLEFL